MRNTLMLLTFLYCSKVFACTEALRTFALECKIQERFQGLSSEFSVFSIAMTELKGFKIPKAIGNISNLSSINELIDHTESTLEQNKQWIIWNNGQKYISSLGSSSLEINDILKLHKSLFGGKIIFNIGSDYGKLRTSNGVTNPKITYSCSDKVLNDKTFDVLNDYDLKSAEGYPLLRLDNLKECDDRNFSSANLYFYKGASVRMELNRWILDLNDMLYRYETQNAFADLSPYNYFADMKRWFLAIKPFNMGNEEVIDALIDYATKRIQLPPISLNDSGVPIFLSADENRELSIKKIHETLSFFEGCLYQIKTKQVSQACSSLK